MSEEKKMLGFYNGEIKEGQRIFQEGSKIYEMNFAQPCIGYVPVLSKSLCGFPIEGKGNIERILGAINSTIEEPKKLALDDFL